MAQLGNLSAELETLNQVLSLVEAFRAFDADNDGCITAAELGGIMSSLGYNASDQDVRSMMQQGDTNKDGLLSLTEFLELNTKNLELGALANFLNTAFEGLNFQFGDDEVVTAEALYEVAGNVGVGLSLENCQAIVSAMDADGDGAVSFDDLKRLRRRQRWAHHSSRAWWLNESGWLQRTKEVMAMMQQGNTREGWTVKPDRVLGAQFQLF